MYQAALVRGLCSQGPAFKTHPGALVWAERVEGPGTHPRRGEVARSWREFPAGPAADPSGLPKCSFIGEGLGGTMRGCRGAGFLGLQCPGGLRFALPGIQVHTWVYVCVSVHVCLCNLSMLQVAVLHVCACTRVSVQCMHVPIDTCVYVCMYVRVSVHVYLCVRRCICVCACKCTLGALRIQQGALWVEAWLPDSFLTSNQKKLESPQLGAWRSSLSFRSVSSLLWDIGEPFHHDVPQFPHMENGEWSKPPVFGEHSQAHSVTDIPCTPWPLQQPWKEGGCYFICPIRQLRDHRQMK